MEFSQQNAAYPKWKYVIGYAANGLKNIMNQKDYFFPLSLSRIIHKASECRK